MFIISGVILFVFVLSIPISRLIKSRAMDHIIENIGLTLIAGVNLINLNGDIPDILLYSLLVAAIIVLLFLVIEIFRHRSKDQ